MTDSFHIGVAPNVWFGTTAENQEQFDRRWPYLRQIPAAVRFISYEPALGPLSIEAAVYKDACGCLEFDSTIDRSKPCPCKGTGAVSELDWVVCGGETGPGSRPMHPDWVRSVRDQCQAVAIPFFFKQWGDWVPTWGGGDHIIYRDDGLVLAHDHEHPDAWKYKKAEPVRRVGKQAAGRLLDGREWNELPTVDV